jgi:Na+/H+ antiporter NhaD/arsenite permease-like protein
MLNLSAKWNGTALVVWLVIVLGSGAGIWGQEPEVADTSSPPTATAPAGETAAPVAESDHPKADEAHGHDHEGAHGEGAGDDHHGHEHGKMRQEMPLWTVIPFAALLLCIAILPLATPHWWEHNQNKAYIVAALSLPMVIYFATAWGDVGREELLHKVLEYVSFIILLGSLYIISGGIYIRGSLNGTPLANTGLLALGTIISSFIGTTGASVLLIRPLLRANRSRKNVAHVVVFFIFTVSNCGGLLTPLGDPPLFMGFMKGVPFEWTLRLWPIWLTVNLALLVIFNIWDQFALDREEKARPGSQLEEVMKHEPLGVDGALNFVFLLGIVATIYCSGNFPIAGRLPWPFGIQEGIMAALAAAAYFTTAPSNRENNKFTFGPIIEVAVLFIGIFITMTPALLILNAWGDTGEFGREVAGQKLTVSEPWQFFWVTGLLSSCLDNAPTYIAIAATACGIHNVPVADGPYLKEFLAKGDLTARLLAAISCGAVFMGANTYIGNGPNFMVKAIAEEGGVRMPSFFGYILYSAAILIPIFVVVTLLFFR